MHMAFTDRVKEILSWYASDNPGTRTQLARLLMTGSLAGTGKLVILPVDQGFEHGPLRSFGPNLDAHDPDYHFQLAIDAGCNAYAAPLGFLEAGAAKFAGQIPLILKLNNSDTLAKMEPCSAITGSVEDALRLGCVAIGYTIYPGLRPAQHDVPGSARADARGQAQGLSRRGLGVSARHWPQQRRRDGDRRRRVRARISPHSSAPTSSRSSRRPRTSSSRRAKKALEKAADPREPRSPIECATS